MSSTDTSIEPGGRPGELMCLVADGLRACGHDVRLPGGEDSRRLSVQRAAGRCVLFVDDRQPAISASVRTPAAVSLPSRAFSTAAVARASARARWVGEVGALK
jgi:hypothetical protein